MIKADDGQQLNIGYACLALGVIGTAMKTCRLEGATPERIETLTAGNLNALETLIRYNAHNSIRLFRISSDLVPFGSHPSKPFAWQYAFASRLSEIGKLIKASSMRVSMHPGQYTVLNSTNPVVIQRAIDDLVYHERVLSGLKTDSASKIVLHIGGVFSNKKEALQRFCTHFIYLDDAVKRRLVIENDDRCFHIGDVLETAVKLKIPVVFDTLHHQINGCGAKAPYEWIDLCRATWRSQDGTQKIHYAQQDETKRPGAHSKTIRVSAFLDFAQQLKNERIDIMLEVKDKNLSAVKCALCLDQNGCIKTLEKQWRLYKYLVLEKNPSGYSAIRELLKDKSAYPAAAFFEIIDTSREMAENTGFAVNAAQQVWNCFKTLCTPAEKAIFKKLINSYRSGQNSFSRVKSYLFKLSVKYNTTYLTDSYFFIGE